MIFDGQQNIERVYNEKCIDELKRLDSCLLKSIC